MATLSAEDKRALLSAAPLFKGLNENQLGEVVRAASSKQLARREELFHKGDEGAEVYVIADGKLKALTTSLEGDDIVFSVIGPGEAFGEIALFAGTPRTATVVAIDPCKLLVVHRRELFALLKEHPEVSITLIRVMAERLARLSELLEDTLFLHLPVRLAKKLSALADAYGERTGEGVRVDLKLSQQEWGNLVGVTRESINKQVRAWTKQGILTTNRGYIVIHRPEELTKIATEFLF